MAREQHKLSLRAGAGGGSLRSTFPRCHCHCHCCEGCRGGVPAGEAGGRRGGGGGASMNSLIMSRFMLLLPWVLLVIMMLDTDGGNRAPRPSSHLNRRPQPQLREQAPEWREAELQHLPLIYAITPTYTRPVQKAELTRLANTLRQVARLHWILVEDSARGTELVSRFAAGLVRGGGPPCTHLHVPTPRKYKRPGQPRATEQRNAGLAWIRQRHQHVRSQKPAVIFFADDDNTYSLELFEEMRLTHKVSVWPVGLVSGRLYERPVVEKGKVVDWYTGWWAGRHFAIDMAGFAVSLQVILSNPRAGFRRRGLRPGMQESDFLRQITTMEDLEPKANNCTKVLVWHTRTEKVNLGREPKCRLDNVKIEV